MKNSWEKITNQYLQMKLNQLDRPTLNFFYRLSLYGMSLQFDNKLLELFYQDALQSLIQKLLRKSNHIRKALSLRLKLSEAICLFWTLEFWNAALPGTYAENILQKYFLPLQTINQ